MKWVIYCFILIFLVAGCAAKSKIVENTAAQTGIVSPQPETKPEQEKKRIDKKEIFSQAEQLLQEAQTLATKNEFEPAKNRAEQGIKLLLEVEKEKLSPKEVQRFDDLLRALLECWRCSHEAIFTPSYTQIQPSAELGWELMPEVEQAIRTYLGPRRVELTNAVWRAGLYINRVKKIIKEEGVPEDLAYLPIIESAYSPFAVSPAGAVGAWQFIEPTARKYGLTVNRWVDERRDIEKSTRAACRYLKDLKQLLGSWQLALAAYNCGEARVGQALNNISQEEFKYSDLPLPYETRNYVPAFFAVLAIIKYPDIFGLQLLYSQEPQITELELKQPTDLEKFATLLDIEYQEIKLLNPELQGKYTPLEGSYYLKVPQTRFAEVSEKLNKFAPEQIYLSDQQVNEIKTERNRVAYKVRNGDTLGKIAHKFGVTISDIKKSNPKVARRKYLRAGEILIIYSRSTSYSRSAGSASDKDFHYTVKKGDTLSGIAQKFDVSLSDIKSWNPHLKDGKSIYPGIRLVIKSTK